MQYNGPAVGFLALCGVLATAILVPLSEPETRLGTRFQDTLSDGYFPLAGPGTSLLERHGINVLAVHARTAAELDQLFSDLDYRWPLDGDAAIPAVEVSALPLDLDRLEVAKKKSIFFRTLLPLVAMENRIVREQRAVITAAFASGPIDHAGKTNATLRNIAKQYRVKGNLDAPEVRETLLRRVDIVPPGLVLAQAANESGWGTSRFARNANNLFGVWTYKRRAGLKPSDRAAGANHAVRAYPSLRRAVRSYLFNINVGHAYQELRRIRETLRHDGHPLDPHELAAGLSRYSSRGEAYVAEIRRLIRINKLNGMTHLRLASAAE